VPCNSFEREPEKNLFSLKDAFRERYNLVTFFVLRTQKVTRLVVVNSILFYGFDFVSAHSLSCRLSCSVFGTFYWSIYLNELTLMLHHPLLKEPLKC
jgi:hypothetical protein